MTQRAFTVSSGGVTIVNAVCTLVFINPPASPNVDLEFLRAWVAQGGVTAPVQQRVQLEEQATAFPTLTSATPRALNKSDTAASTITGGTAGAAGTAGINASAEGAGTKTSYWDDVFDVLSGWLWVPTPEERTEFPAGYTKGNGLYLPAAPGATTNWAFGMIFAEK